jgi:phage-related holin
MHFVSKILNEVIWRRRDSWKTIIIVAKGLSLYFLLSCAQLIQVTCLHKVSTVNCFHFLLFRVENELLIHRFIKSRV